MARRAIVLLARVVIPLGVIALTLFLAWAWFSKAIQEYQRQERDASPEADTQRTQRWRTNLAEDPCNHKQSSC